MTSATPQVLSLYQRHLLASFEKQVRLERWLPETANWQLNLAGGQLLFREGCDFADEADEADEDAWSCQILGTEDEKTNTWLWAWDNRASNIPPALLTDAARLRQFGQEQNLTEFAQPIVALDGLDGHGLCLIGSAVCPFDAYFRAPFAGGAVFLSLHDPRLRLEHRPAIERALLVISRAVALLPLPNPRLAIWEYLAFLGLTIHERQQALVVTEEGTPVLRIDFDEHGRVVKINTLVGDRSDLGLPERSYLPTLGP